jgi:transcriptional regulator with XRE-family HTH domain
VSGPGTSFGAVLRDARQRAGVSLTDLAGRIHYSKGYLSKVETGKALPNLDLARRYDAALDAQGSLYGAAAAAARTGLAGTGGAAGAAAAEPLALSRRDALLVGAVSLLGVGTGLRALRATATADGADRYFLDMLGALHRQGWEQPPALLLPTLIAQSDAATALAAVAPDRQRADLLVAAARLAEFTGWMYQEADDLVAMRRWTRRAHDLATEAGDAGIPAYVLVRHANVALYGGDGESTVSLARRAADSRGPARVAGVAELHEAQGHALLGSSDGVRRSLDRARDRLDSAPAQRPSLGISSPVDQVALVGGWCAYELGRPDEAAEVLGQELARLSPQARRTRARFGCREAMALAADGQVDEACAATRRVLADLRTIDSATVRLDLRRLYRLLLRRSTTPAVRGVSAEVADALTS